jgi:hypothetical protein
MLFGISGTANLFWMQDYGFLNGLEQKKSGRSRLRSCNLLLILSIVIVIRQAPTGWLVQFILLELACVKLTQVKLPDLQVISV